MYDRSFFQSKLGQASLASIAAMTALIALSTQMQADPMIAFGPNGNAHLIEIA